MIQSYILKILKESSNINKLKKSNMTEAQLKSERLKCRKLNDQYRGYNFILDDESYFTLSNKDKSEDDIFFSDNKEKTR